MLIPIDPPMSWESPVTQVFALLVAGHVCAEFAFPAARDVWAGHGSSAKPMLRIATAAGFHVAFLALAFPSLQGTIVLLTVVLLSYGAVDAVSEWLFGSFPTRAVTCLLIGQGLHLAVLAVAAWVLLRCWPNLSADASFPLESFTTRSSLAKVAVLLSVLTINASGGAAMVKLLLRTLTIEGSDVVCSSDQPAADHYETPPGAGRLIGIIERWLVLGVVWAGQWGVVGLVLAAKSVARFKRMDDQSFAEVYLVGTMTSVLVAVLCGLALSMLFGPLGPAPLA